MTTSQLRMRRSELDAALFGLDLDSPSRESLLDDRRDIQQMLDAVVYPLLTLPFDIISEIFIRCLPLAPYTRPKRTEAPLLLSSTSSSFRSIALSIPSLWATIKIDYGMLSNPARPDVLDRVQSPVETWLSRAGSRPLSICVFPCFKGDDNSLWTMMNAILLHSFQQLQCLDLFLEEAELYKLEGLSSFPLFQRLEIGIYHTSTSSRPADVFRHMPQLKELRLKSLDIFVLPLEKWREIFKFPWNQLTNFNGGPFFAEDLVEVLLLAPSLVKCVISIHVAPRITEFLPQNPVSHSELHSLTICEGAELWILESLTLPSLRHLQLHRWAHLDVDIFKSFLLRSSMPLQTVHLQICESWPTIPRLAECFTFMLAMIGNPTTFLPKLQTLTLLDFDPPSSWYERLVASLSSRGNEHDDFQRLVSFRLILPWFGRTSRADNNTSHHLKDLVTGGVKIHIGSQVINQVYSY
ncbi:hypothetical protein B0H10DRAFT_1976386, partial [Mycena sp. CBHHK59/15]